MQFCPIISHQHFTHCQFHHIIPRFCPSPAALFSLTTGIQACAGSSVSLPSPSTATAAHPRVSFCLWSAHSLHHSLAASSGKHLLPFPSSPLAIRHSPKPLSCLPSDLCLRRFSSFHVYLQTRKELCRRDTEAPAHSILSTYSYCLSTWAHLLLPTRYRDSKIFGEEINIAL